MLYTQHKPEFIIQMQMPEMYLAFNRDYLAE